MESPSINSNLLSKTKVTSIPNLTLEMISDCLIPLPPLAKQQRIVSKIEEIFAILDRINSELGADI
ncbi:restriction endonuclease subunit S [Campylobacter devanensis]|uniref:restriction endonuclease subunit S n=1 Tax=Campylobacter TaxID=194 RepID=UPI000A349F49